MPSAQTIITLAVTELGKNIVGVVPNGDKLAFGLNSLNRMLDQFNLLRGFIFTINKARYTLTQPVPTHGGDKCYTIGPTGDFVADRPLGPGPGAIESANIILTGVSPEVHVPVYILNDSQWADMHVPGVVTTIPIGLYNDGSFPNSKLFLWGVPSQANDLELFTRQQLSRFLTLESEIDFPPGYDDAVILTLAERMSGPLRWPMPPDLPQRARIARANVKSLNSASPLLQSDMPLKSGPQQPYFNYRTGSLS